MSFQRFKLVVALFSLVSLSSALADDVSSHCGPALWKEVKMLAEDCRAQIAAGDECEVLQFFQGDDSTTQRAAFRLNGQEYSAELFESQYSDGGDLNDLLIKRDDGCRLERTSIPAFGDLLKALSR